MAQQRSEETHELPSNPAPDPGPDALREQRLRGGWSPAEVQGPEDGRRAHRGHARRLPVHRGNPGVVPGRMPLLDVGVRQRGVLLRVGDGVPEQGDSTSRCQRV